jgi:hypothetical protein
MQIVKQSTAFTVIVGPILDSTGAEYTGAVIGDLSISKNGTEAAMASAATLTHVSNGHYTLVGTTGNSDTLGRLDIRCNKSTYQMPPLRYEVLAAAPFDTLVTNGTLASTTSGRTIVTDAAGLADANVVKVGPTGSGTAQTARDIGAAVPAAAAGASGGLLISGSNSGTTTLGAFTITGAMTFTGAITGSNASNSINLGTDSIGSTQLASSGVTEIRDAITGYAGSLNLDSGGNVKVSDGTGANQIDTVSGGIAHVVLCDTTTTNTDLVTASAVWAAGTRTLTAGTNINGSTFTSIPWNAAWDAEVQSEAEDALAAVGVTTTVTGRIDAAVTTRMATYTQPTGFLAATFPGTVASTTNITSATGLDVTKLNGTSIAGTGSRVADGFVSFLNVAVPTLTLGGVNQTGDTYAEVTNGTYGLNAIKTLVGPSSIRSAVGLASANLDTQLAALPTATSIRNAVTGGAYALDTDANGRIRIVDGTGAGELDTSSGKVLLAGTQTFDNTGTWTGNITGNLSGTVGSVTGAVGSVTGAVGSVTGAVGSVTGNVGGNVTGSVGSVASGGIDAATITAAAGNKLADISRRRTQANVEASSFGDTLDLSSLYGFIQQAQESAIAAGTLTVKKTDGTTTLGTKALTSSASAEPIISIA